MKPILYGVCLAILVGCSQSAGPSPKYTALSKRVDDVMQRTKGDPSKLTPEDRKVMDEAKGLGMTTPPGY
jgi:hypothetical protein